MLGGAWGKRRRGVAIGALLLPLAGCGQTAERSPSEPATTGDQSVFSDISALVQISGFDFEDSKSRAADGTPLLRYGDSIRVRINDGTRESRVPGLEIFAGEAELSEFGSAGLPEQFTYQGSRVDPLDRRPLELTFRYLGESFSIALVPLFVTIVSPVDNSRFDLDSVPVLVWSELAREPASLELDGGCRVEFDVREVNSSGASFSARQPDAAFETPCEVQLESAWSVDEQPDSPLAALNVQRSTRRLQRLTLE